MPLHKESPDKDQKGSEVSLSTPKSPSPPDVVVHPEQLLVEAVPSELVPVHTTPWVVADEGTTPEASSSMSFSRFMVVRSVQLAATCVVPSGSTYGTAL